MNKDKFEPKEVLFTTQQELRNHLINAFSKVKKLRFNLISISLLK